MYNLTRAELASLESFFFADFVKCVLVVFLYDCAHLRQNLLKNIPFKVLRSFHEQKMVEDKASFAGNTNVLSRSSTKYYFIFCRQNLSSSTLVRLCILVKIFATLGLCLLPHSNFSHSLPHKTRFVNTLFENFLRFS